MIPTIDFSLIGVILAIWSVIRTIWDWCTKALDWVMHRALSLLIGSKFWATAAFLSVAVFLIGLFVTVFGAIIQYLISIGFNSPVIRDSQVFSLINILIPLESLTSLAAFCLSCLTTYFTVLNLDFTRKALIKFFTLLSKAWKT